MSHVKLLDIFLVPDPTFVGFVIPKWMSFYSNNNLKINF